MPRPSADASRVLDVLLEPRARPPAPTDRATARLLAGCLLALLIFFGCYDSYMATAHPGYTPPWGGYLLLATGYGLVRAGYFSAAAWLTVGTIPTVAFLLVVLGISGAPTVTTSLPVLAVLLGTLLLSARAIIGITVGSVLAVWLTTVVPTPHRLTVGEVSGSLLIVGLGGALGALSVTHRTRLERDRRAALLTQAQELERRVQERTEELAQTVRELESFSYTVSHDLRAPLRAIEGFATILEEDHGEKLGAEGRETLSVVLGSARRMSELIDGLLRLSRVTRAQVQRDEVDLVPLARNIARTLEVVGGTPTDFVMPDALVVHADPSLVATIMENLLSNAHKFSRGSDEPRIELGSTLKDGERYCFVKDNGAGFDMAHSARLFRPFERLHRQEEFPGTGIGLATVWRAVERHGGHLFAEAEPGHGATIYFRLDARSAAPLQG